MENFADTVFFKFLIISVINAATSIFATVIILKQQIKFINENLKRIDAEMIRLWESKRG